VTVPKGLSAAEHAFIVAQANLPGPLQGLHAARNTNAAPVKLSDWFGAACSRLALALPDFDD
jgi:hypothetical protein